MAFFRKKEERADTEGAVSFEGGLLTALLGGSSGITKAQAMQIPTVRACIGLIADKISSLPIKLYEENEGKVREITDDNRLTLLNKDTGDTLNATELKKRWVIDYFLGKGSYTYIEKNLFGDVIGLYYVDEDRVSVIPGNNPIYKSYSLQVNGSTYLPHKFIKILRNTKGYGKGISIVEENFTILSVYYNTMKFENANAKKGGNKRGFLKAQNKLSKETADSVKEAWARLYSNDIENAEKAILLNDGIDFKELSSTSVEMQLNQNKRLNADEICKIFGMPPLMLSGNASEAVQSQFLLNCLTPVINTIEAALDADMLREDEKANRYYAFDVSELTRGDFAKRMSGYAVAINSNIMQIDEVREREDLPPLGFNYIKLGLQDVLLDPKTGVIYTPNTNQMVRMGEVANNLENGLQGGEKDDIMGNEERAKYIKLPNGKFNGSMPSAGKVKMSVKEVKRVSSQFLTDFPNAEKGKIYRYENRNHFYLVKVNEQGNYEFRCKIPIDGNEQKIQAICRSVELW